MKHPVYFLVIDHDQTVRIHKNPIFNILYEVMLIIEFEVTFSCGHDIRLRSKCT